jgi:hypothetical protein
MLWLHFSKGAVIVLLAEGLRVAVSAAADHDDASQWPPNHEVEGWHRWTLLLNF